MYLLTLPNILPILSNLLLLLTPTSAVAPRHGQLRILNHCPFPIHIHDNDGNITTAPATTRPRPFRAPFGIHPHGASSIYIKKDAFVDPFFGPESQYISFATGVHDGRGGDEEVWYSAEYRTGGKSVNPFVGSHVIPAGGVGGDCKILNCEGHDGSGCFFDQGRCEAKFSISVNVCG